MKRSCICVLLTVAAFAQAPGTSPRLRIGPVYTTEFPNLDIVVEASAGGTAGASLNAIDLILTEEGVRTATAQGLRKFSETGQGVAVLLALDVSGSMKGRPLDAVRKGLGQFVSKARDNDKIGVISFADDVRWEAQWSGTREETRQRIEGIRARGRYTVLWDAIDTALDDLAKVDGPARRHLVVISDGHDEGSKKTLAEVIAKAVSLGIPVDAIGMTRSDPRYLENLKALSDQSKGSYTTAPTLDSLTQLVSNAIDRMLDTPVARFRVAKLKSDGARHRVGVYWKAAAIEDETSVLMPSATQQQGPSNTPSTQTTRKMLLWWYGAIGGCAAALVLIVWLMIRRRRSSALPPHALPASLPASWTPPAPEPWLETPDFPTPDFPASALPPPEALPPRVSDSLPPPPSAKPRARTQYAAAFNPPALLMAKSGPLAGKVLRVDHTDFWVGAAENNHLRLDDETVSGNHAYFRFEAETLKLFDNHSTNDTWVNQQAIGGTGRLLSPGDEIRIGRSIFVIQRGSDATMKNVAQSGPPFALS